MLRPRLVAAVASMTLVLLAAPSHSSANAASNAVAARTAFFGASNVNQSTGAVRSDRVIAAWAGVSTFALAIKGNVVLLDAWVPDFYPKYVPTTPTQLAQLKPSRIFIGHGHFDHALDAVPIAKASGATIVGTAEHCAEFRKQWASVKCSAASPAAAALGTTTSYTGLPGVSVTVVRNLHSGITAPDGSHKPFLPLPPSLRVIKTLGDPLNGLNVLSHFGDPEGGALLYRFRVGTFDLVWHDSAGPLVDTEGGEQVVAALRRMAPVDVQLGAIQGYNEFVNGFRDPVTYIKALKPARFVPNHHDDWLPVVSVPASQMAEPFAESIAREGLKTPVTFLLDPTDYLRPARLTWKP